MDLFDAMRTTATCRQFGEADVPAGLLHSVLDAARFAPNGGNRQAWRVVAVRDEGSRARLAELYQLPWTAYRIRRTGRPPDPEAPPGSVDHFAAHLREVPVHLTVWGRVEALAIMDADLGRPSITGGASIYPFVQNLLLGLHAAGLGAALTTMLCAQEEPVKALLGIGDDLALACVVFVGRPSALLPSRLRREPVESFAKFDRLDGPPVTPAD